MKTPFKLITVTFLFLFFTSVQTIEAQFLKKLKNKIERKVEDKIDRKIDKEIDKTLEGESKKEDKKDKETKENSEDKPNENSDKKEVSSEEVKDFKIYSKFDFVSGDKLLFFDDFSNDFIGDFPSKWDTNGSGEIVTFNESPEKWFELKSGYNTFYMPLMSSKLPEEYTIEFDIFTNGLNRQTSSTATLEIILDDNDTFKYGANRARAYLPFCQYIPVDIRVDNKISGERTIYSNLKADLRDEVLNKPHISIAVNKQRYRFWVNEKKYVDIPRMIGKDAPMKIMKFHVNGFKDGEERIFIKNLKIAEGGIDLRRKLISEGKISTNGILFDSGSANIQPQSYGIIRQISQVLMQERTMRLNIIGHTDADGNDENNLKLSKKRAEAVKNALINVYNITADRLEAEGKGETVPVGDNSTTDGKAQNRRVDFVKIN